VKKIIALDLYDIHAYIPEDINYICPNCWYDKILDDTAKMDSNIKEILYYLFSANIDRLHDLFDDDEIVYIKRYLKKETFISHLKKIISNFWKSENKELHAPIPFYFIGLDQLDINCLFIPDNNI